MASSLLLRILIAIGMCSIAALAQTGLQGKITDPQSAPVANARLSLHAAGGAIIASTVSDSDGTYKFTGIPSGSYILEVESDAFSLASRQIAIEKTGTAKNEDFKLAIGGLAQTVIVTASDGAQTIDQTTKAISVVSAEEINNRNETNLAEIVRSVPGVQIRQLGGPGALTQIRMRGLRPDASAVLIDGMRFRDPTTTQGDASSFVANMTFVNAKQVEVLRGSGSSLYGTSAVGGAVNIVSDDGGGPTHGMIQAEGGGLGFMRGRATIGGAFMSNRLLYSGGFTHLNVINGVDGNDANRSNGGQAFLRYDFTPKTRLSGRFYGARDFLQSNVTPGTGGIPSANFGSSNIIPAIPLAPDQVLNLNRNLPVNYGNATYIPGRDDTDSRRSSTFFTSAVKLQHDIGNKVNLQAAYQRLNTNRIFQNGPGGGGFQPVATNTTNPGGYIDNIDLRAGIRVSKIFQVSVGYEFEREFFNDRQNNGLPAPRTILVNGKVRQRANAAFIQNQFSLFRDRLLVSASGRVQTFNLRRPEFAIQGTANNYNRDLPSPPTAWTGDLSLAYLIPESGTKIRAHMGNAYRAPALYERFGAGFSNVPATGAVIFTPYGDPTLLPDRYNTYDFGVDQYLLQSRVRLSATYFYNRIKQLTAFDSSGIIRPATDPWGRTSGYLNGAGGISRGLEFGYEARFATNTTLNGSYTFTNAVNDRDFQIAGFWRALTTPRHTATFVITQRIGKKIDVTMDLFRGSSFIVPFFAISRTRAFESPGFTKADLVAGYKIWDAERKKLRAYVKVENFLNRNYYENGWRTPGAWAIGGLQFTY